MSVHTEKEGGCMYGRISHNSDIGNLGYPRFFLRISESSKSFDCLQLNGGVNIYIFIRMYYS